MTELSASPLSLASAGVPDPDNPVFLFDTTEWNEEIKFEDVVPAARTEARRYHLTQFKTITNPTAWNRYLHLGLYSYDDGLEFDCIWDDPEKTWYKRHKIVWYTYWYHRQHNIATPMKLQVWAIEVSKPFLMENAPGFLEINTRKMSWKDLYYGDYDPMEEDAISNDDGEEAA